MIANEIRQKFLAFMAERGHAIIPSAPVVPEHDPTVLFTTAGMHPLVPYLLGEPHPAGKRLASIQKCIRTVDIEEVGDDSHLTFFEMLGNWSLGDYFKEDSIAWTWQFLTKELKLDPKLMAVSVFAGDDDAPKDEEAAALWHAQGVPKNRIFYYGKDDNWWGPAGQTGPCGPDSEVFYWTGSGRPTGEPATHDGWLELWNNVFMQYEKSADGSFAPLSQQNVDTGMGLERLAVILQGKHHVYETDLFAPILKAIRAIASQRDERAERIVADHLRTATVIAADGVQPANTERGYILRRLIRRAIRQARKLGITDAFTARVADVVITEFSGAYPELQRNHVLVREALQQEEAKFARTLDRGLKELSKLRQPDGQALFRLFETYGIPLEVSLEELGLRDTKQLEAAFAAAQKAHQEQSRAGAEHKFAGGLADHSEQTVRLHTATHLLNAALRDVLGTHVKQRGSNITAERLRFDFSHPEKLTDQQLTQITALVNEWIREDLPVERREMPRTEAERIGAEMEFGHKYPEVVSVYFVGAPEAARSIEFCGGPHVARTGELGEFAITKQESVGAGVRRLKAVLRP